MRVRRPADRESRGGDSNRLQTLVCSFGHDPDDVALLVEVAYASPADDHKLAAEVHGPAGIPVYWIVDANGRRVEVDTGPGPHGYGPPAIFAEGQSVPVVIDGREAGRIAVADILPPPRPRAEAGGDRA
jgi:Putative restriction endonuclease